MTKKDFVTIARTLRVLQEALPTRTHELVVGIFAGRLDNENERFDRVKFVKESLSTDRAKELDEKGYDLERYGNRDELTAATIRTRVPSKWRFVDLETGDVWKLDDEGHFVAAHSDDGVEWGCGAS